MALSDLLEYFRPLAAAEQTVGGVPLLLTPQTNVLALNCAYGLGPQRRAALLSECEARRVPALVLSGEVWDGEDVGGLRVGRFAAEAEDAGPVTGAGIVTEQVSRLQLPVWAAVLAESYATPEWAPLLARHFAAVLEGRRDYVLLLAYAGTEAVGAGLWQARRRGGALHLWGTLAEDAGASLLGTAAGLGGGDLRVSLPDSSPLSVVDEEVLAFSRVPCA